jgi:hypothetical protein
MSRYTGDWEALAPEKYRAQTFDNCITEIYCGGVFLPNETKHKVPTWLVLGEVVGVHIASHLLKDGVYDTAIAGHILRGGGPADYFTIGP